MRRLPVSEYLTNRHLVAWLISVTVVMSQCLHGQDAGDQRSSVGFGERCAIGRPSARLFLEGVFNLFTGIFDVGLRLVAPALIPSALITSDVAKRLLGLATEVLCFVLRLIRTAHNRLLLFLDRPYVGQALSLLGYLASRSSNVVATCSDGEVPVGNTAGAQLFDHPLVALPLRRVPHTSRVVLSADN